MKFNRKQRKAIDRKVNEFARSYEPAQFASLVRANRGLITLHKYPTPQYAYYAKRLERKLLLLKR